MCRCPECRSEFDALQNTVRALSLVSSLQPTTERVHGVLGTPPALAPKSVPKPGAQRLVPDDSQPNPANPPPINGFVSAATKPQVERVIRRSVQTTSGTQFVVAKRFSHGRRSQLPALLAFVAVILLLAGGSAAIAFIFYAANRAEVPQTGTVQPPANVAAEMPMDDEATIDASNPPIKADEPSAEELAALWHKTRPFVVTIRVESGETTREGLGVVVDQRGWVATSYHLVRDARRVTVSLAESGDGAGSQPQQLEAKGFVAMAPDDELAIIAIDGLPMPIKTAPATGDISAPVANDLLVCCRRPVASDAGWLVTATMQKLVARQDLPLPAIQENPASDRASADKALWISHSLPPDPTSDGGPLLTHDGQLIGINVFINAAATDGIAVPIQRLQRLVASASGTITPFDSGRISVAKPVSPKPVSSKPVRPEPGTLESLDLMRKLHTECRDMNWLPQTAADYAKLQLLAEYLHAAKITEDNNRIEEGLRVIIGTTAQEMLVDLSESPWPTDEQISELDTLAIASLSSPDQGLFAYVEVTNPSPQAPPINGQKTIVARLIGSEQFIALPVQKNDDQLKKGSRWLLLGLHDKEKSIMLDVVTPPRETPLVQAKYILGEPQSLGVPADGSGKKPSRPKRS